MGLFDDLKGKKYPGSRKAGGRMGRVYAGPPRKQEDDSEETPLAAGVYAGPGMMGGLRPDDPEMTEVYAGPGMMGEIGCDEPEEPAEEAPAEDAPAEEAPRNPKPAGSMIWKTRSMSILPLSPGSARGRSISAVPPISAPTCWQI